MKWGLWSTTAASNSATPPDGWPEGQAPSTVNDCAREMMAAIATGLQDLQFIDLGLAPTQVSGYQFTASGSDGAALHYGRRVKVYDGAATLYATVISATFTTNAAVALRFDTGTQPLDSSLSSFAVGSPSANNNAIPENVYRNKNYIDNSQFDVWNRGYGPFSFSSNTAFTADRWFINCSIASAGPTLSVAAPQRSSGASNVPALAQCGVLMNLAYGITVGTGQSSQANTDLVVLGQNIEGYTFRQLAQKPMAFSFWARGDITGTYCVSFHNTANNQSIVFEYQLSGVSTWEKKTFQIPPSPSAGTWDYSTGVGLSVRFAIAAGSNSQGAPGVWTTSGNYATSNQVNLMANAGKTLLFSGIKLEEGYQSTPLSNIDFREETARCGRFLFPFSGAALGFATTTSAAFFDINFPNPLRGAASASFVQAVSKLVIGIPGVFAESVSAIVLVLNSNTNCIVKGTVVGTPLTLGNGAYIQYSAGTGTPWVLFKAEI